MTQPHGIEAQVCADIAARQALGMAKYGTSVAENPLSLRQWLHHAYEETLDKAVYLRRAIAELDAQAVPYIGPDRRKAAEPAATVEQSSIADADGWIKWESGECPVPEGTRVDIRKRNCEVELDLPAYQFDVPLHVTRAATNWGSIISGSPYNIAAYRRSKEASHG